MDDNSGGDSRYEFMIGMRRVGRMSKIKLKE